ncbi:hypothetical protein J7T55_006115 [Diaporthe amygdali]|uniref:uncharacterized protein n=1 Tax=Phomopsis amygdali TaxID=1214568 RepID=UPI0022FE2C73|nr:uncharacterized protein J7T55_006115 [Diaporthe amygdali]KAJ0124774.1 hypothetical protein J7T55_006115 [Diaporthe amygdali]
MDGLCVEEISVGLGVGEPVGGEGPDSDGVGTDGVGIDGVGMEGVGSDGVGIGGVGIGGVGIEGPEIDPVMLGVALEPVSIDDDRPDVVLVRLALEIVEEEPAVKEIEVEEPEAGELDIWELGRDELLGKVLDTKELLVGGGILVCEDVLLEEDKETEPDKVVSVDFHTVGVWLDMAADELEPELCPGGTTAVGDEGLVMRLELDQVELGVKLSTVLLTDGTTLIGAEVGHPSDVEGWELPYVSLLALPTTELPPDVERVDGEVGKPGT